MTAPVQWVWSDVAATSHPDVTILRHLAHEATLLVRSGRLLRGNAYATAPRRVRHDLARVGAIVRLRERKRYYLHAAGAVDPAGAAWLLTGDTGSGKSTLAFALSRAGWSVLGDDGVIVEHTSAGPIAHPWRDPLRVSLSLRDRYPLLADIPDAPLPGDDRQRVPVSGTQASSARIAGILLLHQSPVHELTRVSALEALAAIVRQSPWVALGDAVAATHYRALHQLVEKVPVFRLTHSAAQLDTIAHMLREAA